MNVKREIIFSGDPQQTYETGGEDVCVCMVGGGRKGRKRACRYVKEKSQNDQTS